MCACVTYYGRSTTIIVARSCGFQAATWSLRSSGFKSATWCLRCFRCLYTIASYVAVEGFGEDLHNLQRMHDPAQGSNCSAVQSCVRGDGFVAFVSDYVASQPAPLTQATPSLCSSSASMSLVSSDLVAHFQRLGRSLPATWSLASSALPSPHRSMCFECIVSRGVVDEPGVCPHVPRRVPARGLAARGVQVVRPVAAWARGAARGHAAAAQSTADDPQCRVLGGARSLASEPSQKGRCATGSPCQPIRTKLNQKQQIKT